MAGADRETVGGVPAAVRQAGLSEVRAEDGQSGKARSGDVQVGDVQSGEAQSGEAQAGETQAGELQGTGAGVARHYAASGAGSEIAARVVAAVRALSGDGALTPEMLAPFDHFHGRGLMATRELSAALEARAGEAVLDIGSGIGGPARWIAAATGCSVTGVDLTAEFCDAAIELNRLTRSDGSVRILQGSATALPVPDAAFDRAYSQNVVMNIADKLAVYREARRALKMGGRLVLSHLGAGTGVPYFPAPWASEAGNSHLATDAETRRDLASAGFEIVSFDDVSDAAIASSRAARERAAVEGLGPGPHVIMGTGRFVEMMGNMGRSLAEGRVRSVEIVAIAV